MNPKYRLVLLDSDISGRYNKNNDNLLLSKYDSHLLKTKSNFRKEEKIFNHLCKESYM